MNCDISILEGSLHMTDKELKIATEGIQKDSHHSYYNHKYEPTSYEILEQLFDEIPLSSSDTFVDYGCGKGRLNFYVNHRFHCHSIGIELNKDYYQDAVENLHSYSGIHKEKIQFHCMLAQSYVLNGSETYFYFFNPFSVEIFRHVIQNIYDSIEEQPRDCTLILYYPDEDYIFYLENNTGLQFVKEIKLMGSQKDSRECFCIYRF